MVAKRLGLDSGLVSGRDSEEGTFANLRRVNIGRLICEQGQGDSGQCLKVG